MPYSIQVDKARQLIIQRISSGYSDADSCSAIREIRQLREFPHYGLVIDMREVRPLSISPGHIARLSYCIRTEVPVITRAIVPPDDGGREAVEKFVDLARGAFAQTRLIESFEEACEWAGRPVAAYVRFAQDDAITVSS